MRPSTAEEVAEIVKFAATEKLALVAMRRSHKIGNGPAAAPVRSRARHDSPRSRDRLRSRRPHPQRGSRHAASQTRREFSPSTINCSRSPVPYLNRTTIGGAVASGVDSPLRQFYGTARDYLLGMEFVTGEGVAAKSGGRVVKNVTGYDIHKLMIGALGTLGVITRLNFKTFPMPLPARAFVARFETVERAWTCAIASRSRRSRRMTMEIFSPRVADLFCQRRRSRVRRAAMPARRTFQNAMDAHGGILRKRTRADTLRR